MQWHVDTMFFFRGFVWIEGWLTRENPLRKLVAVFPAGETRVFDGSLNVPSPDLIAGHGPAGENARFSCHVPVATSADAMVMRIFAEVDPGAWIELEDFRANMLATDRYHALQATFYGMLGTITSGRVLEIGSRNRSGVLRRQLIPSHLEYVGLDILPGQNVDIVGDAHQLSDMFERESFAAVFATSVFEHLMMPWKAAVEINHVLKPQGLVMLTSHQIWPLHETPWDYWRFSDQAWHALFNTATGFEVLETALGEKGSVVAHVLHAPTQDLDCQPAFCGSAMLSRKIKNCSLEWNVGIRDLTSSLYPA